MKDEDKNLIFYEKAKKEWEQSPNDIDSSKTNKEYFDKETAKFNDEVFARANERFSERAKKERETFFTCSHCKEKVSLADEMKHELHHTLHLSWKSKTSDERVRTVGQTVLVLIGVVLFLGWLWVMISLSFGPGPEKGEPYPGDCILPSGDLC